MNLAKITDDMQDDNSKLNKFMNWLFVVCAFGIFVMGIAFLYGLIFK